VIPSELPAVLVVLAGATAGGYAVVRLFAGDLRRGERLAWSMACGIALLAGVSAVLMKAGLVPGPRKFAGVLALLVLVSFLVLRPRRLPSPAHRPEHASILTVVLFALALLAILLFAAQAVRGGMWATDHLAIWGLKARTFYATASIPARIFRDPALVFSNPAYPLLVPLSLSSLAAATRAWDASSLALLYPFFALATVLAVAGFLGRRVSALAGAAGGLLVALCAPLYAPGNVGTAEIPMALGFVLVSTAFLDALERETAANCARLFLGALFCAATKTEGSLFVLLLAAAAVSQAWRRRTGSWRIVLALLLPLLGHAFGMRLLRGSLDSRFVDWSLLSPARLAELPAKVRDVLLQIAGVEMPHAVLALLALAILLLVARSGIADPLVAVVVLQTLAYVAACVLSAFDPVWQVDSALSRLTWTLFPVWALVLCARAFPGRADGREGSGQRTQRRVFPIAVVVGLTILALVLAPTAVQSLLGEKRVLPPGNARPTFHASVEPILQAHCQTCHRAGGIAPMALMSYEDAESHGRSIFRQVSSRRMPPWKAGRECQVFANDPSLTLKEIATIVRWVETGAPEGNPEEAPPPRRFPDSWELGTPDLVLKAPVFTPDFSKGDLYQCFVLPTNLETNAWVSAVEVKPGNRTIVHHALLYVEEGIASRDRDADAPGPGYPCFGGPRVSVTDSFGEWAPGMQTRFYPTGIARFLPRKSRIIMQVHYSALYGSVEPDASEVGVYFAKEPIAKRLLSNDVRSDAPFTIPAGAVSHTLRGKLGPLESRAELVAILPHMHLLGRTMEVTARFPDGSKHCLVDVEDWDLRWQRTYYYKAPVILPKGTVLELSATFDNSYANPNNPSEPHVDVHFGERTTDEMCMALLFWTVDGKNPGERDAFFRGEVCGAPGRLTPTPTPVAP
jgi:hypothetical protein